jgi:hypothetical protein
VVNTLFCAKVFVRRRGPGTVEAFEVLQVISSQNEAINVALINHETKRLLWKGQRHAQMAARSIGKAWQRGKGKA